MKTRILNAFVVVVMFSSLVACKNVSKPALENGVWRATLKTESGAEIPFNFEVKDSAGLKVLDIINGKDRFRVNEITMNKDSVHIQMPLFDSEIKAELKDGNLSGKWIKHLAIQDAIMEFNAESNTPWRFFKSDIGTKNNLAGRWSTTFVSQDKKDTTWAVGEFTHDGSKLTGTFLTSTGDYRFLEGTVADNNLYLSCFDGSNAYLFTGKLENDSTIVNGNFYSGLSSLENWTARKDEKAMLPDAYSLTALKPGYTKIDFSFPDLNGKKVSLSDPKFKNKVVIVQFLGSWCPNCMDETAFLVPFYQKYKNRGLEIVGLAYERTADMERSKKNVERLKNRFNITYDLLLTGYTKDKGQVTASLPMLNNFEAFPTTIIIDKKGKVRKIHTGFSGPGTGSHYTDFVKEFEKNIDALLAEKI
ncbi:MAG TPA: TlpA disulfide reductase family protein [Daejeonella sp.]|nr:TlpA disulfide reductase family protein [Daejeonella sp.]